MNTCDDIAPQLSELIDGTLPAEDRRRVDAHLETCDRCRGLRRDLERIRRTARALAPVPPPDHVWLEVAGHVHPPGPGRGRQTHAVDARVAARQWIGIAAMLVLVTVAAYFVMRSPAAPAPGGNAPAVESVEAVRDEMDKARQSYENAIRKLEPLVTEGREALDPATAATLLSSIEKIDGAIAESQAALGQAPGSAPARESLFEALKTKVGILQATLNLMNEMRKGDQAAAAEAAAAFGKKSS
jgi:hypothetical protein